ncbi:MAG: endopeptidase La [Alphaproteobacteria bacterium]
MAKSKRKTHYPVLPLRNIVVFPGMVAPLFIGRSKSVRALEAAIEGDLPLLLITQLEEDTETPDDGGLYKVGTLANIVQVLEMPDGTVKAMVEGIARYKVDVLDQEGEFIEAAASLIEDDEADEVEITALMRAVVNRFENYVGQNKKISSDVFNNIAQISEAGLLADSIVPHLGLRISERQALLEISSPNERLEKVYGYMEGEIGVMVVEKKIRNRVKRQMEKNQREYYLNEQMKAIKRELGDGEDSGDELAELEEKIAKTKLTKEARDKANAELRKLKSMSPMSAEATVVRNYLDWLLSIPWKKYSKVNHDPSVAQAVLDEDHYGLEKVKERIIEYLAVQARQTRLKGPILCLVGPPGVGKTSLGKSIANATGRQFVRMSLGGVRDESEVRGHRRTYIGSMPGKVVQGMKKAKTANPLFLLDEIDKLGNDWRGDPSAALLEVLDPEQNSTFSDHYLEVDYDLSQVMFVTTANSMNLPQPLIDRLEVIRIAGYTESEKMEIAKRHLVPKQTREHGLVDGEFEVDDDALLDLLHYYTREAGVRNLEREIARLARKAVKQIVTEEASQIKITSDNLKDFAGVQKYRYGQIDDEDQIGIVTGLAYTSVGGDILTIEAVTMPGDGKFTKTGKLGDVMQESIDIAGILIKSRSPSFGIHPKKFKRNNVHVHVPEGATPKDGPSAGIAMVTAMVSVLTGNPIRKDVAMTGEITLRGRVLPIGGLKEKLLAALRGGVKTVIIPKDNEKDLEDVPEIVQENLTIIPARTIEEVLEHALSQKLSPIDWDPVAEEAAEERRQDALLARTLKDDLDVPSIRH